MYDTDLMTARVVMLRFVTDNIDPNARLIGGVIHAEIGDRPVHITINDTPATVAYESLQTLRERGLQALRDAG